MNKSNFRKRNGLFRVRVSPNSNPLAFKILLYICPYQTFWGFHCLKTFRSQIVYVNYTFFLLFPHLYILFQSNTHKYIQYYNKWLRKKRDLFASILFLIYREIMYTPLNCMPFGWSKLALHLIGQGLNVFCLITLQDALIPTFLKQFPSPTITEIITCFTVIW